MHQVGYNTLQQYLECIATAWSAITTQYNAGCSVIFVTTVAVREFSVGRIATVRTENISVVLPIAYSV